MSDSALLALHGKEILPWIPSIAQLRITVFREYPYLYEGTLESEEEFLQIYAQSERSLLVLAKEEERVIGAVTGVPLDESYPEIKDLFAKNIIPASDVFYLGEILLYREYRKKLIGQRMYKAFEKAVPKKYRKIALAEVARSPFDPRKPFDYISLEKFWTLKGYMKYPELLCFFSWKDIGASEATEKPMIFWIKELSRS